MVNEEQFDEIMPHPLVASLGIERMYNLWGCRTELLTGVDLRLDTTRCVHKEFKTYYELVRSIVASIVGIEEDRV